MLWLHIFLLIVFLNFSAMNLFDGSWSEIHYFSMFLFTSLRLIRYASEASVSSLFVNFHASKSLSFTYKLWRASWNLFVSSDKSPSSTFFAVLGFLFFTPLEQAFVEASLIPLALLWVPDDLSHSFSAIWWPLPNECGNLEERN